MSNHCNTKRFTIGPMKKDSMKANLYNLNEINKVMNEIKNK